LLLLLLLLLLLFVLTSPEDHVRLGHGSRIQGSERGDERLDQWT
jgi:hypothetical protein